MSKKKSKATKPVNALDVFTNAVGFRVASGLLNDHPLRKLLHFQMAITEAFALELYIKTLHIIRGNSVSGHDVHALFHELSVVDQITIENYFSEMLPAYRGYSAAKEWGLRLDLESVLLRSRETFIKYRYWHEGVTPAGDLDGFTSNVGTDCISIAIERLIKEIHPEWTLDKIMESINLPEIIYQDPPPSA